MEIATSDDIEGDDWYDYMIMTRAALNAFLMQDKAEGEAITLPLNKLAARA